MPVKKKKVAIFDIDGTIFRSSLVIELNKKLVSEGIFPNETTGEILASFLRWTDRKGSYEDYINQVVKTHAKYLKGSREKDVSQNSKKVVNEMKNRVYVYTRELIKKIRRDHLLLAISGSPIEIVREFAGIYGFDFYWGTEMEVKNGKYTGRVLNRPVDDKRKVLEDFLKLSKLDSGGSIGVGDTESDISFLEIVENSICFNPNKKLCEVATKHGWDIVVERKDVIHYLTDMSRPFRNVIL